jgi:hypothetical protein
MQVPKIPRGTFTIGGLVALALGLPLVTVALGLAYQAFHFGPADASDARVGVFAAIFAGFPTFLAGGGVARLVAHRVAEGRAASPIASLLRGALGMGVAGAGAALLTAVPLGDLPERPTAWWPVGVAGLCAGVVSGLAVAVLVAGRAERHRRAADPVP